MSNETVAVPSTDIQQRKQEHPNVIFILTDDQGYGELGCHGNKYIQTPNLDILHEDSIRFVDYHALKELIPEYKTAHFGKWHLGDTHPFRPFIRGFDLSIYHGGGGVGNTPDAWGNDYFDDTYLVNGTPKKFQGYCTDVFFQEAMDFIQSMADTNTPFYCHLATNAPHGPFNVENHYSDMYKDQAESMDRACFYGMVTNIDENVGKLRAHLQELGLDKTTILIFMSDNGSGGGVTCDDEGHVTEGACNYNGGMRGIKSWEYEGGHRVPFFLHVPNAILPMSAPRDVVELTSYIDFMPSILDLCGCQDIPPNRVEAMHGISLGPTIRGWEQPELHHRTIVVDTQRVARPVKWHRSCVMRNRWRLIDGMELYDLDSGPHQLDDIASERPGLVARDSPFVLDDAVAEITLTTHDIRNDAGDAAWHHVQIRQGETVSGYWPLDVRLADKYTIELRRWPESTKYPLMAGIDGDDSNWRKDCIQPKYAKYYEGGIALDIKWAHLEVAGQSTYAQIQDPHAASVRFQRDLPLGEKQLFAGFYEKRPFGSNRTIAPYYIYISRTGQK